MVAGEIFIRYTDENFPFLLGPTVNPSMDIQVASNFERWLYYKLGSDPAATAAKMAEFRNNNRMAIPLSRTGTVDSEIVAGTSDTARTLATIHDFHTKHHYLLDPHTAAGVFVASQYNELEDPMICLATAHPAKFAKAIHDATGEDGLAHHPILDALADAPTRCDIVPADPAAVKTYLAARALPA